MNGDVLFEFDVGRLVARHRAGGSRATLALLPNPDPRVYGPVVTDRTGRVLSLSGRPKGRRGTTSLFAGVHVIDPALLDLLHEGASDSVRDLYVPLVAAGVRIDGVRVRGAWYDLGRPRSYRDTQLRLLPGRGGGRVLLHRQAAVSESALLRRAIVGEGARVGPGSRVERSILWDGAVVEAGARVEGGIVATGGIVRRGERARDVMVLPTGVLQKKEDAGARFEERDGMAWVDLR